ncbi:MAG: hypothetical protein QOG50_2730 [Actinomycetota bacterium]|nr:hypothetical protein [Actinomycetota bacterium]
MTQGSRRPAPWTIIGNGNDNGNRHGRAAAPWWAGRGAGPRVPFSGGGGESSSGGGGAASELPGPRRGFSPAMVPWIVAAGAVLGILMASAQLFASPVLSRVLVPVFGLFATLAAAKWLSARHPDEPWLARILVLAVLAKEFASVLRNRTLVNSYGHVGDATDYDLNGRQFVNVWMHKAHALAPRLDNIRKTNFLRWFTGVVYYLFGSDAIAGFIVFGLIAFVGSYLWYRATVEAVPFIDRRLYFLIVMFAPSILFWPSSIGKEALMQFAIGSAALGTAHMFNGRILRGVLVAAPGAWLMSVVRAHLLGLVALAAAAAFVIGRSPRKARASTATSSLVKPLGMVIVVFVAVFAVSAGANSLGLPTLSLSAVQAELDATTVNTGHGNSAFNNGGNSLSPLRLPQGMVTVLLRPFPWEVDSPLQILASLEGMALAAFIVWRRKSLAISLRHIRTIPFLFYCWTLTILYSVTFQAFANFGLLDRQRALVLPALYVLLCLDPQKAREFDDERDNRLGLTTVGSSGRGAR